MTLDEFMKLPGAYQLHAAFNIGHLLHRPV